ncbi:hypothetical protein SISSUDRAFT_701797 [Sistotremastrum suecicum HHB10207 ss-3]|uniref:Pentacotripeptide-repeat region of PRORP domain-containing protein n=1 Tax=Sistotremastrum suecicum HHB10207 ss-3 TaxID=1314776 RepID=A0A166DVU8_9AGAM|nr:hypothetical protein SISSUDRAFT_701797 [Sistotremastrum suecicum HHB10207 ss-3]
MFQLWSRTQRPPTCSHFKAAHIQGRCAIPSFRLHAAAFAAPSQPSEPEIRYTTSQISRAAGKTIRLAFGEGDSRNAFFVFTSLCKNHDEKPSVVLPSVIEPLPFSNLVTPRFAGHCLIHQLLRAGLTIKAARCTDKLLFARVKLHPRTLSAVIQALCRSSLPPRMNLPKPDGQVDESSWLSQPVRIAVHLLDLSRRRGQLCAHPTYLDVIHACLAQGRPDIAAHQYSALVRAWYINPFPSPAIPSFSSSSSSLTHHVLPAIQRRKSQAYLPDSTLMLPILQYVNQRLNLHARRIPYHDAIDLSRCLQALAQFATLLDEQLIRSRDISLLLSVLCKVPKVQDKVAVKLKGRNKSTMVFAQPYVRYLLLHFTKTLLSGPETRPDIRMPSPNISTYNALIHFALRVQRSPKLAGRLLHQMVKQRSPPILPNPTTFNILLRSASLMHRNELAREIIQRFSAGLPISSLNDEPVVGSSTGVPTTDVNDSLSMRRISSLLSSPKKPHNVCSDPYAIVALLGHVVSAGTPGQAPDLIHRIIPELHSQAKDRRALIVGRLVQLGPHVLAAMLNALHKSGNFRFAEYVWTLARQAERSSWTAEPSGSGPPWFIPIEAYTSMVQVYSASYRRALNTSRAITRRSSSKGSPSTASRRAAMTPMAHVARTRVAKLYRHLLDTRRRFRLTTEESLSVDDNNGFRIPIPDARFFNALLEIYGRHPLMARRAPQASPSRWRRRFVRSLSRFVEWGRVPRIFDPGLVTILRAMTRHGYPIPKAYREISLGHPEIADPLGANWTTDRKEAGNRDYFYIPVDKDRGMPAKGRWRPRCPNR